MAKHSIIEYYGGDSGHRCGYCGLPDTNLSKGMWAHSLTIDDYEGMLNRNFRRSGKYCYKPSMKELCCPMYMIRCDVTQFKPSKSQKKVLKRMYRYLATGEVPGSSEASAQQTGKDDDSATSAPIREEVNVQRPQSKVTAEGVGPVGTRTVDASSDRPLSAAGATSNSGPAPAALARPPGKQSKAKEMRRARWRKKKLAEGKSTEPVVKKDAAEKTLDDFFNAPLPENPVHKLEVRLVQSHPRSAKFGETFVESHALYHKYQVKIHGDSEHEAGESQYTRFLVDSPLQDEPMPGVEDMRLGSYHAQYLMDGRIIAVEVMDVMRHCVSSVYLYYDTDFAFLSLGTYSALRSLWQVQLFQKKLEMLKYYVMGYYIQSCPKMIYKGNFHSSFLLCPESYEWVPLEKCRAKLERSKYSRLDDTDKEDPDVDVDLNEVLVLHQRQAMQFKVYRMVAKLTPDSQSERQTREYSGLAGRRLACRMLLYRR